MRIRMLTISLLAVLGAFGLVTDASAQRSAAPSAQQASNVRVQLHRALQQLQTRGNILPRGAQATQPVLVGAGNRDMVQSAGGGSITGFVKGTIDRENAPIVMAFAPNGETDVAYAGAVTPDGNYEIGALPAGEYMVVLQAQNCVTKFYDNVYTPEEAKLVRVDGSGETGGIDFVMELLPVGTGSISGKVRADWTNEPVNGAIVMAYSNDRPYDYREAVVAEDGTYTIEGLFSGNYIVSAMGYGFFPSYYENAATPELATPVIVTEPGDRPGIDFLLSRGAIIAGRVLDHNGNPVPNTIVEAIQDPANDSMNMPGAYGMGVTDENGNYEIATLAEGEYLVSARIWTERFGMTLWYDGVIDPANATRVATSLGTPATGIDFNFQLPIGNGSIAGVVLDRDGGPVAGVSIMVMTAKNSSGGVFLYTSAMTGPDGRYRVDSLPDGEFVVGAFASDGWQPVNIWWRDAMTPEEADMVVLEGGVCLPGSVDFTLPIDLGSATVTGTVKNADGSPLMGAMVMLMPTEPNNEFPMFGNIVSTDEAGRYTFNSVPAGSYLVYAMAWQNEMYGEQWYLNASTPDLATAIELSDDESLSGVDFTLNLRSYYGSISGRVTDDASGEPIMGAHVLISQIYGANDPYRPVGDMMLTTDEHGSYAADFIPEGKYQVMVISNGAFEVYDNATSPDEATPVAVIGGESTTVNFGLTTRNEGTASISGLVTNENAQSLAGAVVLAFAEEDPMSIPFAAISSGDGEYDLTGLAAGRYYVYAFAEGYVGEFYDNAFDASDAKLVTVGDNSSASGIDFNLDGILCFPGGGQPGDPRTGGAIHGTIADVDGKPLSGATVYLMNDAGEAMASVRSGVDGRYELVNLPAAATYRLMASSPGYDSRYNNHAPTFEEAAPVAVATGRAIEIDFELDRGVSSAPIETGSSAGLTLSGNHPNPFAATTGIEFSLGRSGRVQVTVLDILGNEVARLHDGPMASGSNVVRWNGTTADGSAARSGIYIYRVTVDGVSKSGRMVLAR